MMQDEPLEVRQAREAFVRAIARAQGAQAHAARSGTATAMTTMLAAQAEVDAAGAFLHELRIAAGLRPRPKSVGLERRRRRLGV